MTRLSPSTWADTTPSVTVPQQFDHRIPSHVYGTGVAAVVAFIDDPHRFRNAKAIGRCFGLVPSQDQCAAGLSHRDVR